MAYFGDNAIHAWGCAGVTGNLNSGYNIDDVDDNGAGDATMNFSTNAANANYATNISTKTTSNNAESVTAVHTSYVAYVRVRTGYTYYGGMAWYDYGSHGFQFACYSTF